MGVLERRLLEFDGKAVSILSEARMACRDQPGYLNDLADVCFDPRQPVSDGATWILKAELEDGMELPPEVIARIIEAVGDIRSRQAVLHLCQSIEMLNLTPAQAKRFLEWARSYENHARPFLRAWSLHARVILGNRFAEFEDEVAVALKTAETDQAASVRARARQLRKAQVHATNWKNK